MDMLDDVDFVLSSTVDTTGTKVFVHFLTAEAVRQAFNEAREIFIREGYAFPLNTFWVSLEELPPGTAAAAGSGFW